MPRKLEDRVSRIKAPSPLGTSLLVGLRAADIILQYNLLARGWGANLITLLGGLPVAFTPVRPTAALGLRPYYAVLFYMALGSSIKQIVWVLAISEQEMPPKLAIPVGLFNSVFNSFNTLLSLWSATSLATPGLWVDVASSPTILLGIGLYVVGILTELVSEFQRKSFKADPANRGKPYGGGLFSLATNVNYGGYTLWRTGYAAVAAGLSYGLALGAFCFYDFATRGIPVLDRYCTQKYGDSWKNIKKRVKYRLIPWIY